jgi:integrase
MIFVAAKRDGYISENPAEDVKVVSQRGLSRTRRPFTIDELKAVYRVADDEWKSMILFSLYTGARLADVASLTWRNVDLLAQEFRYVARKTARSMILPLAGPLAKHVEALEIADSPDVPLHPRAHSILKKQGRAGTLSNQFAKLLSDAGLRAKQAHRKTHGAGRGVGSGHGELSFHSLRHTAVTLLKELGVPQAVVMELVGHESEEMSQHYTRVGLPALRGAAEAFPDITSAGEIRTVV